MPYSSMRKLKKGEQLKFKGMSGHGGARKGAGRPRTSHFISHVARPTIKRDTAVHVNLHLSRSLKSLNLRSKEFFALFRHAVKTARLKGLKIVHYSIMHNHLHLLVEAGSNQELSKGMQSFALSFNKLVANRVNARIKHLWQDRYFMRLLLSPREIKTALTYIIRNPQKKFHRSNMLDWYSSSLALVSDAPSALGQRFALLASEILNVPKGYLLRKTLLL